LPDLTIWACEAETASAPSAVRARSSVAFRIVIRIVGLAYRTSW
jgi:hypothetical protein